MGVFCFLRAGVALVRLVEDRTTLSWLFAVELLQSEGSLIFPRAHCLRRRRLSLTWFEEVIEVFFFVRHHKFRGLSAEGFRMRSQLDTFNSPLLPSSALPCCLRGARVGCCL